jgi:membrane protease YdiL (CAAX protease family)
VSHDLRKLSSIVRSLSRAGGQELGVTTQPLRRACLQGLALCALTAAVPNLVRVLTTLLYFEQRSSLAAVIGSQIGFLATVCLLAWGLLRGSSRSYSRIASRWLTDTAVFVSGAAGMAATALLLAPALSSSRGSSMTMFVVDSLIPAFTEELTFRGVLPLLLTARWSDRHAPRLSIQLSAIMTSASFAVAHWNAMTTLYDWRPMLALFCNGLILTLISRNGRRILPAMLSHALFNAALVRF